MTERFDPDICLDLALTPEGVREIRRLMGWSQESMARQVGVSLNTVFRWETAKHKVTPRHRGAIREAVARAQSVPSSE